MAQPSCDSLPIKHGLLISSDLMISSRVTAMAKDCNTKVDVISHLDRLQESPEHFQYGCILIDLATIPAAVDTLLQQIRSSGISAPAIAFGSHVNTQQLEEAKSAGCDYVLSRGQFSQSLRIIIQEHLVT